MNRLIILLLLLTGCAPKVIVKNAGETRAFPSTKYYESFALLESDSIDFKGQQFIADIAIKDAGLAVNCDYDAVKWLAEEKAREMGGNCLVITEHKLPSSKSTCHRIKGKVYRLDNPEKYEQNITWNSARPLKISNFKGSLEKRPFLAATYSGIKYQTKVIPFAPKSQLYIETVFNCDLSYFKPSEYDSLTLKHEQLHFDISEIYARKFRKEVVENGLTHKTFVETHQSMFTQILKELAIKQDEYDSEVYSDRSLQPKWNDWVKSELQKLDAYKERVIELKMR